MALFSRARKRGYIDRIDPVVVHGWAVTENGQGAELDILIDGRRVACVLADNFRPDLEAAQIAQGHAAFTFDPSPYLRPDRASEIRVQFSGTDKLVRFGKAVLSLTPAAAPAVAAASKAAPANPWNDEAPIDHGNSWPASRPYAKALNRRMTGDPELHWFDYAIRTYISATASSDATASPPTCLILGSNEGGVERMLCAAGFTGPIVASDIAEKALARAAAQCRALRYDNVRHLRADLNKEIPEGPFDFIIAEGVLHHIEQIESCLQRLDHALKPGGLLIAVEYIGAVRFQLPAEQLRWINAALALMPKGLRPPLAAKGEDHLPATAKDNEAIHYVPPPIAAMIAMDPSEAICGPKLDRLLRERFETVEIKPYGCNLLPYLGGHIDFVRCNADRQAERWLTMLIDLEQLLMDEGTLKSDMAFYVMRKRG